MYNYHITNHAEVNRFLGRAKEGAKGSATALKGPVPKDAIWEDGTPNKGQMNIGWRNDTTGEKIDVIYAKMPLFFQVGKYYQHGDDGRVMKVVGCANTYIHDECLVGEERHGNLIPLGNGPDHTQGWRQICAKQFKYHASTPLGPVYQGDNIGSCDVEHGGEI